MIPNKLKSQEEITEILRCKVGGMLRCINEDCMCNTCCKWRGTKLMLERAQALGKRDALIINNIKTAMIGEIGEWVDLLRGLLGEQ